MSFSIQFNLDGSIFFDSSYKYHLWKIIRDNDTFDTSDYTISDIKTISNLSKLYYEYKIPYIICVEEINYIIYDKKVHYENNIVNIDFFINNFIKKYIDHNLYNEFEIMSNV